MSDSHERTVSCAAYGVLGGSNLRLPKDSPGARLVEELPGGDLRITSTEKVSELIRDIGERVVAEHG
jgi:hypothetical protein